MYEKCYRRCRKNLFRNITYEIIPGLSDATTPLSDEQQNLCRNSNDMRVIDFTKIKKHKN